MPHMHVRGKGMTYHLVYPDGRDQIVLSVPKYDFNWQLLYQPAKTIRVPEGDADVRRRVLRQLEGRTDSTRIRSGRCIWAG